MAFGFSLIPGVDCFEFVLFLVEHLKYIVAANVILVVSTKKGLRKWVLLVTPGFVTALTLAAWLGSWEDAKARGFDMAKPSLRSTLEDYIVTGEGQLDKIFGNHAPTFGRHEMNYLIKDLFSHTFLHLDTHNSQNVPLAYNKGNDWFRATLGEPMVYASGIFPSGNETLQEAQRIKLDYVADAIELKKGETVLDIGCGWGRLVQHFTDNYGAKVTGVTLSAEQRAYGLELNGDNGANIFLQDAMKMSERTDLPVGGFDKITSLEMAEHVGIKRYNEFLKKVHGLLKDDGVLYFQVAGFRRQWQYEDLVWGLFMGEHVFPGADASCPIGWVSTHLERAGFEVQRVQNMGTHYSRTLALWLEEWHANSDAVIEKYGEQSYRRWEVFLAWSVRISRLGGSTVWMITATKQGQEATRIRSQAHLAPPTPRAPRGGLSH